MLGLNNGNFTRGTGTGISQVKWTSSGGFAAFTTDRTVNLGGAGATATWNSGSFVPTGSSLILGGAGAAGTLIFENPINLGSATRTIQTDDGTASVDGRLTGILSGAGGITKSGAGTLELTADNSFTGNLGVTAGTLRLSGAVGSANDASGVALSGGGTLLLDNTTNSGDRLKDSGTVSLANGTLSFYHPGSASTNYSETIGALTVTGSGNVVRTYRAAADQTSTLSISSLAYTPGALQFYGEGLGLSDARNRIFIGGTVPLTGGIIGGNATYFDGTTTGSAGYSLANGVVLYAPSASINVRGGVIPDLDTSIGIVEAGSSGSMILSSPIVTIQSLIQNASSAGTLDLQGRTLRAGSVIIGNASAALTLGLSPGDGILMAETNGGILSLNNNYATPLLVNSVIADNGGASSLIKTGGATVQLAGAATYTGATDVSTGTLALVGGGALSDSTAVNLSGASAILDISGITASGETIGSLAGVAGSSVVLGGKNLAAAGASSTSFAGVISGTGGSFIKLGEGALSLTGDNTFTGSLTAGGGTLELTGNNQFTGTLTIGTGATLKVPVILQSGVQPLGPGTTALVFAGNVDHGAQLEYSGSASAILDREINMASGQGGTVNVSHASGVLTLNGALSGAADFHKAGAGTMILPGDETWSGNGAVLGGTLILGGAALPGANSLSAGNCSISPVPRCASIPLAHWKPPPSPATGHSIWNPARCAPMPSPAPEHSNGETPPWRPSPTSPRVR
ncbi:MAG: autotransporter-associated beta strand repeat-containing protein [Kiritimatiellia bacterium]